MLRDGDLDWSTLSPAERALLEYVEVVTKHAYRVTDEQVQDLRAAGWSEDQIAEATYVAALFNFFVRIADAFALEPPPEVEPEGEPRALKLATRDAWAS